MMRVKLSFLCLMLLAVLSANVQGATVSWTGNDTDFGAGYNWNTTSFPTTADTAIMNNGLPTHNTEGRLWLHDPTFVSYAPDDFDTAPPNPMGTLWVGSNGLTGTIDQQTYTLEAQNDVIIGQGAAAAGAPGGTGTLNLSGDAIFNHTTAGSFIVGQGSGVATDPVTTGNINMSGNAQINSINPIYIGNGAGGVANVTLSGSAQLNQIFQWPPPAGEFHIGNAGSTGTLTLNDQSTVNVWNHINIGQGVDQTTNTGHGNLIINSGTFNKWGFGGMWVGAQTASGVVTQNGGLVDLTKDCSIWSDPFFADGCLVLGQWGNAANFNDGTPKPYTTEGVYHLNGGTLKANSIEGAWYGKGEMFFNGGTVIPYKSVDNFTRFTYGDDATTDTLLLWVQAGGAKFDTNGTTIGIGMPLQADPNSPGGGLVKMGLGNLKLNAANTYTGLTSVLQGTLGGSGSITGAVDVASGAGIFPGDPARLNVGSVTFEPGSFLDIMIASSTSSDSLNVVGTLSIAAGDALNVLLDPAYVPAVGDSFDVLDWGSKTGDFTLNLPALSGGLTWDSSMFESSGVLTIAPEPSTIVLLVMGALMLYWRRKR
jgi:autotransporter-associated beta strand protein